MKVFAFVVIVLVCPYLYGQDPLPRHVNVVGIANDEIIPDEVVFNLHVTSKNKDYEDAGKQLERKVRSLLRELRREDFEDRVSTFLVGIRKVYEYNQGRKTDSAYLASQEFEVRFPVNQDRIMDAMEAIRDSETNTEYSYRFRLSKEKRNEEVKRLSGLAVKDARSKAEELAAAAGVSLLTLYSITFEDNAPVTYRMETMAMGRSDTSQADPKKIPIDVQVRVIWLIE